MSEEKFEQLELDFTEGEKEMEEVKVLEGNEAQVVDTQPTTDAPQAPQEDQGPKVVAAVTISALDNGQLTINTPEGMPELKPEEIEVVARQVYEQLRDMRIAQAALDLFKARLS